MATTSFAGNPQIWASYNLTLENKQFDTQMKHFLLQLSQWATLIQNYVTPGSYYSPGQGPQGPQGPVGPQGPTGPAGATGAAGLPAYSTTTLSSITIPPVGSTVVVNVANASWATPGEMIYIAGAGGPGQAGALQITAISGNQLTLLNPPPAPAIPPADNTQAGLLKQLSGNTTDYVGGDNACHLLSYTSLAGVPATFAPSPHAATHITGGSDTIAPASSSAAGLLKTLSGNTTDYVGGDNACHALAAQVASLLFTTWTTFTLTASSNTGTITTQSSTAAYLLIGKLCFIHFMVNVTNIGTASGNTTLSGLPVAPARYATFVMRENNVNGLTYIWTVSTGSVSGQVSVASSNANPTWVNNINYVGQGIYQTQ